MNTQAVKDTEASIISACLHDNKLIDDLYTRIAPEMFSMTGHGELWQAMCELNFEGSSVTPVEVSIRNPQLAMKLGARLTELFMWPTGKIDKHVERLIDSYTRREVMKELSNLQAKVTEMASIDEISGDLEQLTSLIHQVGTPQQLHFANVEKYLADLREKREHPEKAVGFLTGWQMFDSLTTGFKRKHLVVVGARTSIGKSAFAEELVTRLIRRQVKVGVFSLEMDESDFIDRITANVANLFYTRVQVGRIQDEEYKEVEKIARTFVKKMAIMDERNMRTDAIIAQIKRWKRQQGLDVVIVDYLQEIEEQALRDDMGGSKLTRIVRKLRKAAKDCDCTVIALSQLNRDAEGDEEPTIANFAGSTGIENVADMTILLHRSRDKDTSYMSVNIAKYRHGKTGRVQMYYDRDHQRISEVTNDHAPN